MIHDVVQLLIVFKQEQKYVKYLGPQKNVGYCGEDNLPWKKQKEVLKAD